jgi:hypothetical protein
MVTKKGTAIKIKSKNERIQKIKKLKKFIQK